MRSPAKIWLDQLSINSLTIPANKEMLRQHHAMSESKRNACREAATTTDGMNTRPGHLM